MQANPNEPPRVWGSIWYQAPSSGTWYEMRTGVLNTYLAWDNTPPQPGAWPALWLPAGTKPSGESRSWHNY